MLSAGSKFVVASIGILVTHAAAGEEIVLRANSPVPLEAIQYVARYSVPTLIDLKRGATVDTAIKVTCGYWNEALAQEARRLNDRSTKISGKLVMPGCVYAKRNAHVKILEGDTLDTLLRREVGVVSEFKLQCGSIEKSRGCGLSFRKLVGDLNPRSEPG